MDLPTNNDKRLNDLNDQKIIEFAPAIAYVVIVMVFGIFGNVFTIVYYGFRASRSTTNILITALAVTDLVTCFVYSGEIIELCYTFTFSDVTGCRSMYFMNHWMVYTSGCILLFIGVDRYRMICKRKFWQVKIQSAKYGVAAIVVFCGLLSSKDFIIFDVYPVNLTVTDYNQSITGYYCAQSKDGVMASIAYGANFIDLVMFLAIIQSMIILYSLVARKVWKHRIKTHSPITKSSTSETQVVNPEISTISSGEGADTTLTNPGTFAVTNLTVSATVQESNLTISCSTEAETNRTISGSVLEANVSISGTVPETNLSEEVKTLDTNEYNENNFNNVNTLTVPQKGQGISYGERGDMGDTSKNGGKQINKCFTEKYTRKKRARRLERKIAVMMIVTTAASIVSFVPHFVLNLIVRINSDTENNQEFNVGLQMVWRSFLLNSAINPYVMGFFNTQFRRFFKHSIYKCLPLNVLK